MNIEYHGANVVMSAPVTISVTLTVTEMRIARHLAIADDNASMLRYYLIRKFRGSLSREQLDSLVQRFVVGELI